ncbi:MAG: hypothetical protein KDD53_02090, partial [Bdellovibrionales bacterium]|nr:hypothetical protein [Bdellovibrionales bacterium]
YLCKARSLGLGSILGQFGAGIVSFLFGGLPFWIYNLEYNFVSFEMFHSSEVNSLGDHLYGYLNSALPILLGARRYWHDSDLLPGLSLWVLSLYVFILICFLGFYLREWTSLFRLRMSATGVEGLLLLLIAVTAVFLLSSFGYLSKAPRYLLPLYIPIIGIVALTVTKLQDKTNVVGTIIVSLIICINLLSNFYGGRALAGEPFVYNQQRVSHDHTELLNWLRQHQIRQVRTNYWIGYRLAFESKEEVVFSLFQEPRQVRIPEYEARVTKEQERTLPLVLVPAQADRVRRALSVYGIHYHRVDLSGYSVL